MSDRKVQAIEPKKNNAFIQHLLDDIKALDIMLKKGLIEKGISRIGAEQEVCFLNSSYRPAPIVMEFLDKIKDEHYTTELAKFKWKSISIQLSWVENASRKWKMRFSPE